MACILTGLASGFITDLCGGLSFTAYGDFIDAGFTPDSTNWAELFYNNILDIIFDIRQWNCFIFVSYLLSIDRYSMTKVVPTKTY